MERTIIELEKEAKRVKKAVSTQHHYYNNLFIFTITADEKAFPIYAYTRMQKG